MAPVLDVIWVSVCLFRLWKRLGLGPVCCLPSPAPWDGRNGGGVARRRDCFPSLSPNLSQRTDLFCSSPWRPCPPCCFAASSSTKRRVLPNTSQGTKPLIMGGSGTKNKVETLSFPTLSLPSPRPKTVNNVPPASCVLPVPCAPAWPPVLARDAVWEGGKEGGKPLAFWLEHAGAAEMHLPRRHQ